MSDTYQSLISQYHGASKWLQFTSPEYDTLSFHQQKIALYRVDPNLSDELSEYDPQAFGLGLIKSAAEYIFKFLRNCITWMWDGLVKSIARLKAFFSSKQDLAKDVKQNEEAKRKFDQAANQPAPPPSNQSGLATPENPLPVDENPAQTNYIAACKKIADVFATFSGRPVTDYSSVNTVEEAANLFFDTVNQLGRESYPLVVWSGNQDPAFDIAVFHTQDPAQTVHDALNAVMDVRLKLVKGLKEYLPEYNRYAQAVWHSYQTKSQMPHFNEDVRNNFIVDIAQFRQVTSLEEDSIPRMLMQAIERFKGMFEMRFGGQIPPQALIQIQHLFSEQPKIVDQIRHAKLGAVLTEEGLKECVTQQNKAVDMLQKEFATLGKTNRELPNRLKRLLDEYAAMSTAMVMLTNFAITTSGRLMRLSVVYHNYTQDLDKLVKALDEYNAARNALDSNAYPGLFS